MRITVVLFGIALLLSIVSACTRPSSEDAPSSVATSSARIDTLKMGDPITVAGLLIDTRCYAFDKSNVTDDHTRPEGRVPACAGACARQGFPVAVLEEAEPGGQEAIVWILSFPPAVFADYMGKRVQVEGQFRSLGIVVPEQVEMQTETGWTRIM